MRPYPFPATRGLEPAISEILEDQTLHLVLARDGLQISDLQAVIRRWRMKRTLQINTSAAA